MLLSIIKALLKYCRFVLFCLLLAPISLLAFKFKMPNEAADESLSDELRKEKDYGDRKYPLEGTERFTGETSEF